METAFISLGSNLGDREATLREAVEALDRDADVRVVRVASLWETDPVGPPPQGPYLNGAVEVETVLAPYELLRLLQRIEADAGRVRADTPRWSARTLDLDLLFYGSVELRDPTLAVPHPRICERAFVLEPLCEIAPGLEHPSARETIAALAERVRDPAAVRPWASDAWRDFQRARELETEEGGKDGDRSRQHRAGR